jgi:hypothetical protein
MARRTLGLFAALAGSLLAASCFELKPRAEPDPTADSTATGPAGGPAPEPAHPIGRPVAPADEGGTPAGPPPPNFKRADFQPRPKPFGEVVVVESVAVDPARAVLGPVTLFDRVTGRRLTSAARALTVTLEVRNHGDTRKVNYRTWHPDVPTGPDVAVLRDEFGNVYKGVRGGPGVEPLGRTRTASVYPGQAITDVLVFEPPIDRATRLELELPGENIGVAEAIRIEIDVARLRAGGYDRDTDPRAPKKAAARPPAARPGEKKPADKPKPPEPKGDRVDGRTLAERQAVYRKVAPQMERIEADAVKRFGRKPTKDDPVTFSVPYNAFVDAARAKVFTDLFATDRVLRSEAEKILAEGAANGWPKK